MNLNAVAGNFDISRPAISKHIKILTECGLVSIREEGRERLCSANFRRLRDVAAWIEQYRRFWESRLDALEEYLDRDAKNRKAQRKTSRSKNKKR